jgi:hypothetical protein
MTARMPAIVLTCQRYAPIAEHMIDAYSARWPDHPFVFRLPDGPAMQAVAARHPGGIELVPTAEGEGRGRFRAAVLGLLKGLADDQWVYWCIDDKYPIWIDLDSVRRVAAALEGEPSEIAGVSLARGYGAAGARGIGLAASRRIAGLPFRTIANYKRIWLHQFLRVKVLRRLFEGFPEVIGSPKEMDALHAAAVLPDDHRRFMLARTAVVFGESTHRGLLTANCAESLRSQRGLPEGFEISPRRLVIGRRPGWWRRVLALAGRRLSLEKVLPDVFQS